MSIATRRLLEKVVYFLLTCAIVVAVVAWEEPAWPGGLVLQIAILLVLLACARLVAWIVAAALQRIVSGVTKAQP